MSYVPLGPLWPRRVPMPPHIVSAATFPAAIALLPIHVYADLSSCEKTVEAVALLVQEEVDMAMNRFN